MKHTELSAIEYTGPVLLRSQRLLSPPRPTPNKGPHELPCAALRRMPHAERVATRAPMPCPAPHALHAERVAAHAPCTHRFFSFLVVTHAPHAPRRTSGRTSSYALLRTACTPPNEWPRMLPARTASFFSWLLACTGRSVRTDERPQ
jgi:hypothetical protein